MRLRRRRGRLTQSIQGIPPERRVELIAVVGMWQRRELLLLREVDDASAQFVTTLSLRNACVAFHDEAHSLHRAHFVSKIALPSPLIVHAFSERALGYVRLTTVRNAGEHERRALDMCHQAELGLGLPLSVPTSIYHQLFHAVPSWLFLRTHAEAAGWGSDAPPAAFVPLALQSAALGRGKPAAPRRWYGWEFTLRALTRASASDIATATTKLLRRPCMCFARFEATARAFNPGAAIDAPHIRAFREAALRNVHPTLSAPPLAFPAGSSAGADDMLLVSRAGDRRALSNEDSVLDSLGALRRVRHVVLEGLPLSEQMSLVSTASALVGVHGQALAWMPFLPWASRTVGLVEISLATRRGVVNTCYERWSAALGVHYWRVSGSLTGGCTGGATSRDNEAERAHKMLNCNVTVNVGQLLGTVYRAAEVTRRA